jgi:hypothetical protein
MGAVDHCADLLMSLSSDQPPATACCASPMADRLRDFVGEHRCALGQQRGLDLLLALGVGAHAGKVRAGAHMIGQKSARSWR